MPPEDGDGFADVSVIIPAYRAATTIGRALMSVAGQTTKPIESIVVDDGSDDGTREAAEAYRDRMNGIRLTVVTQANAGAGAARNRAIAESSGRYLAFLDADDEWLPEKLQRCMAAFEAGRFTFVCHNVTLVNADGSQRILDCRAAFERTDDPYLSCFLWGFVSTPSAVVCRDAVIAAGGFDPSLRSGQDFELWLSIFRLSGTTVSVLAEPLANYFPTAGGITHQLEMRHDCALRIIGDHAHNLEARGVSPAKILFMRVLVVEYLMLRGYLSQGNLFSAIRILILAPVRALSLAMTLTRRPAVERGDFLGSRATD